MMNSTLPERPLSLQLAELLNNYSIENASTTDITIATQAFIDTIACMLAGSTEPAAAIASKLFHKSNGPSSKFGTGMSTTTLDAAFINAISAHAIDYDDMAALGIHPSAPMIPVLLALGEELGSSGRKLLDAYLVGFEVQIRLTRALFPHHYNVGWHPTATVGTFGSAVAASRLLELNVQQTATAMAMCGSLAAGVKANFGSMTKPLQVGNCARNGLMAALLSRDGFKSNLRALEHKQGFFQAFDGLENVKLEALLEPRPKTLAFSCSSYGIKPFPCCGSTHPTIVAVSNLRKRHGNVDVEKVKALHVQTYKERIPHTNNPFPETSLAAKFSVQYAAAVALLRGAVRLGDFEGDAVQNPPIRRLLHVTTLNARPEKHNPDVNEKCAANVNVEMEDGRIFFGEAFGVTGRGHQNPMTREELWEKFSDCSRQTLTLHESQSVFDLLWTLPELENVVELVCLLASLKKP